MDAVTEPPAKRRRLSSSSAPMDGLLTADPSNAKTLTTLSDLAEAKRQYEVGIREFVTPGIPKFDATLKKRYTDFIVNEILPTGEVVHLRNLRAPKPKPSKNSDIKSEKPSAVEAPTLPVQTTNTSTEEPSEPHNGNRDVLPEVTESDREKLLGYFSESAVTDLLALYELIRAKPGKKSSDYPIVRTDFTTDRSVRSQIHQAIREIFKSSVDSSTDHDGVLILTAAKPISKGKHGNTQNGLHFKNQRPGRLGWADRGGEYLHFTLFKENKDTMEVVSWLTRQMKCNPKASTLR